MEENEKWSYSRSVLEPQGTEGSEYRLEVVNKIFAKLPEPEQTIITLYYFGERTPQEISKFLEMPLTTVTSYLERARKRLQPDEERFIQEFAGSFTLSDSVTENIAQKIAESKLTPSPIKKHLLSLVALGAAAILVTLLLLGLGN